MSIRAGWWITLLSYFVPRKVSLFRKLQISQSGIMVQIRHRISIPRKVLILAWGNNMKVRFLLKDCKKQRYSQQRVVNWCLQEIFILTGCPKPACIVPVIHTTAAGCCLAIRLGYWPSVRSRWLDIGQVLFLRVYRQTESRSINSQKKNEAGLVVFMLLFFLYPIYFFNTLIAVLK